MNAEINIKSDDEETLIKNKSDGIIKAHTKRSVLEYLKKNGCTHSNLEATARRKRDKQAVIDFICRSSEEAELLVNQQCESDSLNNINQWLQMLQRTKASTLCEYEAAAVMNAIVRNETQPKPEQLGGINLTQAYGFLENALIGQPQKKLSAASKAFLCREIELLIAEANNDRSDDESRQMGADLYDRQFKYSSEGALYNFSLNPLFLDK
ncbi:GH15407 [Drosophila grimshawi]|uniref:GH15407 n=1 Tax=Drosophila grimshawi TaxID=7222 RepID=B4J2U1_DROGR|nr:GH15407 [Drosophila grimshawi]